MTNKVNPKALGFEPIQVTAADSNYLAFVIRIKWVSIFLMLSYFSSSIRQVKNIRIGTWQVL